MSVTGSHAPAGLRRDPPVLPSRRRPGLLARLAALLAAGALLLTAAASAAVAAPTRADAPGAAAAKPADEFLAVSCPTDKMCIAVGESSFATTGTMLAERWNGRKWSVTRLAHPPGATNSFLTGVSCTSARACTAVGVDYVPGTGGGPLAERWNGSKWALEVTPSPGNEGVPLAAVSCGSATSCTAVGYYDFGSVGLTSSTLAEHWNGHRWAAQSLPSPGDLGGDLSAVSCPSRLTCTAAGYYNGTGDEGPGTAPLAMRRSSGRWAVEPTPGDATENGTSGLTGVSCPTAGTCTAVGGNAGGGPLVMHWDGLKWRTQTAADQLGLLAFNGVSCASATACTAIGGSYGQRWNGRTWALHRIAVPARARSFNLSAVSCSSARHCTAVGSKYMTVSQVSDVLTVAERWNGRTWAPQATVSP
jgi:hypothetical protein